MGNLISRFSVRNPYYTKIGSHDAGCDCFSLGFYCKLTGIEVSSVGDGWNLILSVFGSFATKCN